MRQSISSLILLAMMLAIAADSYAAGTVRIAGSKGKIPANMPRISIGSYIKQKSVQAGSPITSGGAGNNNSGNSSSNNYATTSRVDGLETRVEALETSNPGNIDLTPYAKQIDVDGLDSRVGVLERAPPIDAYTKVEADYLLDAKQDSLPSGAAGQVLTKTSFGVEWAAPASGGLPQAAGDGIYVVEVNGATTLLKKVSFTSDTY